MPTLQQHGKFQPTVPLPEVSASHHAAPMIARRFLLLEWRASLCLVGAMMLSTGCGPVSEPPPKLGVKNWKISGIGGPVEVRLLPAAGQVMEDYRQWLDSEAATKARLYEATLVGASNQFNFSVKTRTGDTPMGQSLDTLASFTYRSPAGEYELYWSRFGRHNTDFLKLTDQPKTVWLQLNTIVGESKNPQLEIVAFEGLEPVGGVMALKGRKGE
jgi:hypothetical protein